MSGSRSALCAVRIVVWAGWTNSRSRPCLRAISVRAVLVAPIAASAALRAIVGLCEELRPEVLDGELSKSRTTFFAHLRPVSWRCRALRDLLFRRRPWTVW